MIPVSVFAGRKVALFGLGASGLPTASALLAGGADVLAFDDNEAKVTQANLAGIPTADLHAIDWSKIAALVLSPGVPLTHPAPHWTVVEARRAGVEVIGDVELFCRERRKRAPDVPFIAITGTNGKSTTTALIAHILRNAGKDVQMGGNIGTAILSLEPPAHDRFHVIECSSYQIDLAPTLDPSVGILLNISPDHLERHGSMENYAAIKERLVARSKISLVGVDDDWSREIERRLSEREELNVIPVSGHQQMERGYFVRGTEVVSKGNNQTPEQAEVLGDLAGVASLRGQHNAQNAAFACGAVHHFHLKPEVIAHGLRSFPGLAHRMEPLGHKGKVLFVNDSKATNVDSAARALSTFRNIYWIAGGRAKAGGIADLAEFFPRIRKAYLIGEASEDFAATLEGKVEYLSAGTLDRAVPLAASDAASSPADEPVVLLSPACASFDQFRNFEIRGDHFRDLVRALPDILTDWKP